MAMVLVRGLCGPGNRWRLWMTGSDDEARAAYLRIMSWIKVRTTDQTRPPEVARVALTSQQYGRHEYPPPEARSLRDQADRLMLEAMQVLDQDDDDREAMPCP